MGMWVRRPGVAQFKQAVRLFSRGQGERAEAKLRDVVRRLEAKRPAGHPRLMQAGQAHCFALLLLDRTGDAAAGSAKVVADYRQAHGEDDEGAWELALISYELGLLDGQYTEVERLARAAVDHLAELADEDFAFLRLQYQSKLMVGEAIAASGRHADALAWFTEVASDATGDLGDEDTHTLEARLQQVRQLLYLDRKDEAGEVASRLVADTARREDGTRASAAAAHAMTLDPEEAVTAARAALTAYEERQGAGDDEWQILRCVLAEALTTVGRAEEALALLPPRRTLYWTVRSRASFVRAEVLHAAAHPEAPAAAREALDRASARYAPSHHDVLTARSLLAAVCGTPEERVSAAEAWEACFGAEHAEAVAAREVAVG